MAISKESGGEELLYLGAILISFIASLLPFSLSHFLQGRYENQNNQFIETSIAFIKLFCFFISIAIALFFGAQKSEFSATLFCLSIIGGLLAFGLTFFIFVRQRKPSYAETIRIIAGVFAMVIMFILLLGPLAVYQIATGIGLDGKAENTLPGRMIIIVSGIIGAGVAIGLYLKICDWFDVDPEDDAEME